MNNFDEDKWSAEQRALDLRIVDAVHNIGVSRRDRDENRPNELLDVWIASVAEQMTTIRSDIAQIEHEGRRLHWLEVLARMGFPHEPTPPFGGVTETHDPEPPLDPNAGEPDHFTLEPDEDKPEEAAPDA